MRVLHRIDRESYNQLKSVDDYGNSIIQRLYSRAGKKGTGLLSRPKPMALFHPNRRSF